jgi:hypothetical protein
MANRNATGVRCAVADIAVLVPLTCACGSRAAGSSAAGAATARSALASACEQVGAVLSDGPDPSADPVGYAEAQILPLRQVTTSDPALRSAIVRLSGAYQKFYASNGRSSSAKAAVAAASSRLDSICPGAAS